MVVVERTTEELRAELEERTRTEYEGNQVSLQVLGAVVYRQWEEIRRLDDALLARLKDTPDDDLLKELSLFMTDLRHDTVRAVANIGARKTLKEQTQRKLAEQEQHDGNQPG